jgi:ABC-type nickel/cobalt efflux system permease component RcnA
LKRSYLIVRLKHIALTASLLIPLAFIFVVSGTSADEKHKHDEDHEHRQHDAHVHGIAALNLVLEGEELHIELDSPAANIVGFEHEPSSEADYSALYKAVATLKNGDRLFRFNDEAGCRMEKAGVTSALSGEEHSEHADKYAHDHDHEENAERGRERHRHEEHEGETHSNIEAVYYFECDQSGKLTQLTVELFGAFPATEKLNVQYVIESKQGATELTAKDHVVKF